VAKDISRKDKGTLILSHFLLNLCKRKKKKVSYLEEEKVKQAGAEQCQA
jgi:hypothetical protein